MSVIRHTKAATETYCWNICSEGGNFLEIAYLIVDIEKGFLEWKIVICSYGHMGAVQAKMYQPKQFINDKMVLLLNPWHKQKSSEKI